MRGGRSRKVETTVTRTHWPRRSLPGLNDLVAANKLSTEFRSKASATKRNYERYLVLIGEAWGPFLVGGLKPKNALTLKGCLGDNPGCRKPPNLNRQDPYQLGRSARVLRRQSMHLCR